MSRPIPDLDQIRAAMRAGTLPDEAGVVRRLVADAGLDAETRASISARAADLVRAVRGATDPGLMESFLAEYGLSTREGVALMCLAEALLRVPDAGTIDALIEDKIAPSDWGRHLGHSSVVAGQRLDLGPDADRQGAGRDRRGPGARTLRGAVKRLGEPVIRVAVGQAMRELGRNFVLGRDIEEAEKNAAPYQAKGLHLLLRHAGRGGAHRGRCAQYHLAYSDAITALAPACKSTTSATTPASRSSSRRCMRATNSASATG